MHLSQTLVAAATLLCVLGLPLPGRANAESAATAVRERAALAKEDAALARNEVERAPTTATRSSGVEQELADLKAQETAHGLVLTLGDVLFAPDEAKLTADATRKLDPLVALLKAQPKRHIRIAGYADSSGAESTNLELSQRRADAVRNFLVDNGINPDRITARGYGAANPVGSNATAAGRKDNRRVEVIVLRAGKRAAEPTREGKASSRKVGAE